MTKLEFCQHYLYLKGKPLAFPNRPYLPAIYNSTSRQQVIRASRQVEKSTFLACTMLYYAVTYPRAQILYVCPRLEQARVFSNSRLVRMIEESPLVRRILLGQSRRRPPVMNLSFANGSEIFIRAAYESADAIRGISADVLLVDEFQDIADGDLPVLQETLSHSELRKMLITGTPKTVDNHLENVFRQSKAYEYKVACGHCLRDVLLDERCLGPQWPVCPTCTFRIKPKLGRWVARNPDSTWGDGFGVNHLMVAWVNYLDLLERQRTYDPAKFRNECLGLPTQLGDHIVTRAELEACCQPSRTNAQSFQDVPSKYRSHLVAGIDWGGGGISRTALVIGYMDERYCFHVVRLERFAAQEEPDLVLKQVTKVCADFRLRGIAADGAGNGHVNNRLLVTGLIQPNYLYAVIYSTADHEPRQDGMLFRWTVHRSASIGVVFDRVKKNTITFPRVEESGTFLDEFACEVADYDAYQRSIKYTHPATQPDDALHATNYALLIAVREYGGRAMVS